MTGESGGFVILTETTDSNHFTKKEMKH